MSRTSRLGLHFEICPSTKGPEIQVLGNAVLPVCVVTTVIIQKGYVYRGGSWTRPVFDSSNELLDGPINERPTELALQEA